MRPHIIVAKMSAKHATIIQAKANRSESILLKHGFGVFPNLYFRSQDTTVITAAGANLATEEHKLEKHPSRINKNLGMHSQNGLHVVHDSNRKSIVSPQPHPNSTS